MATQRPEPPTQVHTCTHAALPGKTSPAGRFLQEGHPRTNRPTRAFRPLPCLGRLPGSCSGPARAAISSPRPTGSLPLLRVCKWPVPGTARPSKESAPCLARSQRVGSLAKGPSFTSQEPGSWVPCPTSSGRPWAAEDDPWGGGAGVPGRRPRGGPRAPRLTAPSRHGASKCPCTSANHRHTRQSTGHYACVHTSHAHAVAHRPRPRHTVHT